jgi:hypothetical protein
MLKSGLDFHILYKFGFRSLHLFNIPFNYLVPSTEHVQVGDQSESKSIIRSILLHFLKDHNEMKCQDSGWVQFLQMNQGRVFVRIKLCGICFFFHNFGCEEP